MDRGTPRFEASLSVRRTTLTPAEGKWVPRNRPPGCSPKRRPRAGTVEGRRPFQRDARGEPYPSGYRSSRSSARRGPRHLLRKASTESTGGSNLLEPLGASGSGPTPTANVLTDRRGGRTSGSRPDPARPRIRRAHPGNVRRCLQHVHLSMDHRALARGHPNDDRFVGCRAVAALARRQVGPRRSPSGERAAGGIDGYPSRPDPTPPIPRIALLVLGTQEGRRTSWEGIREHLDRRRSWGRRVVIGSWIPVGECKAMRGNNRTD
jgi:hypothetical protein